MAKNPNDVVEAKRLALANARAKRTDKAYWAVEGPKVVAANKKHQKMVDDFIAKSNR